MPGRGRAWVDFQNDVTVKDICQSATENFRSVEHMKRYTTQGMATDQGKSSNVVALAVLAEATDRSIAETGTTTFRPPFVPVALGAMGAGATGMGFAPRRMLSSHQVAEERGATMMEVGLWYRASYFPKPGETSWRQSCDREVGYVRNAGGIADPAMKPTLTDSAAKHREVGAACLEIDFRCFHVANLMTALTTKALRSHESCCGKFGLGFINR